MMRSNRWPWCRNPASLRIDMAIRFVAVMQSHPVAEIVIGAMLIAALGRHVEEHIGAQYFLATPPEGRIGVEDLA